MQDIVIEDLEFGMLIEYYWIDVLINKLPEVIYTRIKHQYDCIWVSYKDRDSIRIRIGPHMYKYFYLYGDAAAIISCGQKNLM